MVRATVIWAIITAIGFVSRTSATLAEERLAWQHDLIAAQKLSQEHGRPLLIFVTTSNCSFCRKMEQKTWAEETVNERLEAAFVPLRLDAGKHPETAAQLGVAGFPTTLIYGADGKLLGHFVGYAPPGRVLPTLDQILGIRAAGPIR